MHLLHLEVVSVYSLCPLLLLLLLLIDSMTKNNCVYTACMLCNPVLSIYIYILVVRKNLFDMLKTSEIRR